MYTAKTGSFTIAHNSLECSNWILPAISRMCQCLLTGLLVRAVSNWSVGSYLRQNVVHGWGGRRLGCVTERERSLAMNPARKYSLISELFTTVIMRIHTTSVNYVCVSAWFDCIIRITGKAHQPTMNTLIGQKCLVWTKKIQLNWYSLRYIHMHWRDPVD